METRYDLTNLTVDEWLEIEIALTTREHELERIRGLMQPATSEAQQATCDILHKMQIRCAGLVRRVRDTSPRCAEKV